MGNTHQRSTGYRSGTRDLFSKKFRTKGGNQPLTTFLRRYKVGDIVDVVCDASQQKGMPHKYYHGRTGKVWNINKRCAPRRSRTGDGRRSGGRKEAIVAQAQARRHECGAVESSVEVGNSARLWRRRRWRYSSTIKKRSIGFPAPIAAGRRER